VAVGLQDAGFEHGYHDTLTKRERLLALLQSDLGFEGYKTGYASHDLHAFAAKFPPQLARLFIQGLSQPGDKVLDPMVGSGTAAVEAMLCGRKAIGIDIDPLALRLSRVKTTRYDLTTLRETTADVVDNARDLQRDKPRMERHLRLRFAKEEQEFINYWFQRSTQIELIALISAMETIVDESARSFLELTFSSIIVTKSGGVSLARDLAHSRPHLDKSKSPKNAIDQFSARAVRNLASLAAIRRCRYKPRIIEGDARKLKLSDDSVDLVVTSPPYANAIDYMRAHKFSLVWLGRTVPELTEFRGKYIGSEKTNGFRSAMLPKQAADVVAQLRRLDSRKSIILEKYFVEMRAVFVEMYRVLKADACSVVVVGCSTMRGLDVQTHQCLARIAQQSGFDVVGIARRQLDRNRRMMPARFGSNGTTGIEQRMHDEYVIGLIKPTK
ncbi:site-specific DNA-methyltransferase, partial [Patescibacteria group bacterium]|nr:site-specific DNA-methyltransferase [Patescibacteria group bacterium]